ncbi:hypothetical protein PoB_007000200 [Plakobranchus ocellatus]|uniref:Uncharacterized protein n=1 Tax=Plakobranchus ocellatus TaxID=259542 RepID=A0AAV4DGW1_9GAST|nr:hypothetical protein PoB_007000200 [Plakobranchus ocellatus]
MFNRIGTSEVPNYFCKVLFKADKDDHYGHYSVLGRKEDADMEFYGKLRKQISNVPTHNILVRTRDLITKEDSSNCGFERNMRKHNLEMKTERSFWNSALRKV